MSVPLHLALYGDLIILALGFAAGAYGGYKYGSKAVAAAQVVEAAADGVKSAASAVVQDVKKA